MYTNCLGVLPSSSSSSSSSVGMGIPLAADQFIAQLHILDSLDLGIFAAGYRATLHIHSIVETCEIRELMHQINPNTLEPIKKKRLDFVRKGAIVVCRIQVVSKTSGKKLAEFQQFGSFTLAAQGITVANGQLIER